MGIPRLRMFAGPNGSGKSTVKADIPVSLLGIYLNPDEIEKEIRKNGEYYIGGMGIQTNKEEIQDFFYNSTLIQKIGRQDEVLAVGYHKGVVDFGNVPSIDSYLASVMTDFLRQKLIQSHRDFTFETVMSSPDKIAILQQAQEEGYRTYLYYVATNDPFINISRVKNRVKMGGHGVSEDKIISRYFRSLDYLLQAIKLTNRAYIFDNSGEKRIWVAEITDGSTLSLQTESIPQWFQKYILDKL